MGKRKKRGTVCEVNESDDLEAVEVKPSRSQLKREAKAAKAKRAHGEMEDDKNRPDQTAWEVYSSGPRCRYCGTRVAKWTYLCCVSCDDDEC